MTILEPGDLLTAIRIPATWAGARFHFEKEREGGRFGKEGRHALRSVGQSPRGQEMRAHVAWDLLSRKARVLT